MKGLDLSKFKKVAEDKNTVTMKHDKGHTLTIALKGLPKIHQEQIKRIKLAEGGDVASDKNPPPVTVNVGTPPVMPTIQSAPTAEPVAPEVPKVPSVLNPNGTMNPGATAQAGQAGAKLASQIQGAEAAAQVPVLQQNVENLAAQNKFAADNVNFVNNAFNNLKDYTNDPKNKFNENAYLDNMSAGRKMTTALGLLLGGAGAGLAGGSNPAEDFLRQQIERNIQGQKERYGRQQTVWSAAKDLFGSNQAADSFARAHQLEYINAKAALISKQLGTPTAAAAYLDLQSKLAPAISKALQDSAVELGNLPGQKGKPAAEPEKQNVPESLKPSEQGAMNGPSHGMPGANASVSSGLLEPDEYADSPLLKPGHEDLKEQARYIPKVKEQTAQLQHDYEQALKADTVLSQLHGIHQKLYKDAQAGGSSGYFRRHDPSLEVPLIGGALSSALVQPMTDTPIHRSYAANRTRIVGDIANALKGTNVSSEEITKMVNDNIPEHGDTPEIVEQKERNIRVFIKNSIDKGLLREAKIVK